MPRLLSVLLALLALPALRAQFEIRVDAEKTGYLEMEPITLVCQVRNAGAARVILGEAATNAVVSLVVRDPTGRPVRRLDTPLMVEPVPVPPERQATFKISLADTHEVRSAGLYTVQAEIRHAGYVHTSAKTTVTVSRGSELVSVAGAEPPRLFLVKTATREDGTHLYIRVDDPAHSTCYGVYEVDRYLAGPAPQKLFDREGRLHFLHQSAPYVFTHVVLSPEGRPLTRDRYKQEFSDTHLALQPDGSVRVAGGKKLE